MKGVRTFSQGGPPGPAARPGRSAGSRASDTKDLAPLFSPAPPPWDVCVLPDRTPPDASLPHQPGKGLILGKVQSHRLLLTRKPSTSWASAFRTSSLGDGQNGLLPKGRAWEARATADCGLGLFLASLPSFTLICQTGRAVHPFQGGDKGQRQLCVKCLVYTK